MPDEATIARLEQEIAEVREIVEENNELLREMRRNGRIGFWVKTAIWIIVLALPFILIGPLLNALVPATAGGQSGVGLFGVPSPDQIQETLNSYRAQMEAVTAPE